MVSTGFPEGQSSLGGGSVSEVPAHDVCKLGQPWPLVLESCPKAQSGRVTDVVAGSGQQKVSYRKDPGRGLALETEAQTLWAAEWAAGS